MIVALIDPAGLIAGASRPRFFGPLSCLPPQQPLWSAIVHLRSACAGDRPDSDDDVVGDLRVPEESGPRATRTGDPARSVGRGRRWCRRRRAERAAQEVLADLQQV